MFLCVCASRGGGAIKLEPASLLSQLSSNIPCGFKSVGPCVCAHVSSFGACPVLVPALPLLQVPVSIAFDEVYQGKSFTWLTYLDCVGSEEGSMRRLESFDSVFFHSLLLLCDRLSSFLSTLTMTLTPIKMCKCIHPAWGLR